MQKTKTVPVRNFILNVKLQATYTTNLEFVPFMTYEKIKCYNYNGVKVTKFFFMIMCTNFILNNLVQNKNIIILLYKEIVKLLFYIFLYFYHTKNL